MRVAPACRTVSKVPLPLVLIEAVVQKRVEKPKGVRLHQSISAADMRARIG